MFSNKVDPLPQKNWRSNVRRPSYINTCESKTQWTLPLSERLKRREQEGEFKKDVDRSAKGLTKQKWNKFKRELREISYKLEPWRASIKAVEGYHGSGVASYFMFMRWSLFLNIGITLLIITFVTIPQVAFPKRDYSPAIFGINKTSVQIDEAVKCSKDYVLKINKTDVKALLLDFLQGSGWMEKTALFYGYYDNKELFTYGKTYIIPLAYLLVSISCLLYSVILMAKKSAASFRDNVEDDRAGDNFQFFSLVFLSWDYTITDAVSAKLKKASIMKQIQTELAEKQYKLKKENLTKNQRILMYTIRVTINIFVLTCLTASAYLIYYVTQYSTNFTKMDTYSGQHKIVKLLVEFMPSLTISALNGFVPIIFSLVIIIEDYAPQNEVIITLGRTILLRLASLIFLVASLYKDVMCKPKNVCGIGMESCTKITCWESYIGQQFYKLVITDFVIKLVLCLTVEPIRKLMAKKLKFKLLPQPQFNVPQNVLDLVYIQSLCWLGFFFAPLITCMVLISIFITFYLKKLSALHWCAASVKPYKASKSQSLFASVLMVSFFLCCLPIGYVICKVPPSRSCGPFRIYKYMYEILTVTLEFWPISAAITISFLTSGAFVLTIIIVLLLFLYYFYKKIASQSATIKILSNKLNSERKEKYYFMVEASKSLKQGQANREYPTQARELEEATGSTEVLDENKS
ncbi:transmembrane channel-like protein 7 isoform X2 [Octopus sinensis]|uniref:Transmembrane channel-like protein 7 isoform X2 n=1 Tax=Octopus sinensis TaxID=2607531 RepID=A0A6P7SKH6_9MOLL|nr:transmembrane channel-like protein 7 isoform X2 [Octopus sinensis]